ncbi:hypothetical protein EOM86_05630 [Candidatus Nomurabacteria bacterium]|nr:hypothetical protein [Candidatus Nomurabacteria bacterium]
MRKNYGLKHFSQIDLGIVLFAIIMISLGACLLASLEIYPMLVGSFAAGVGAGFLLSEIVKVSLKDESDEEGSGAA